jgi:hypothetical protein
VTSKFAESDLLAFGGCVSLRFSLTLLFPFLALVVPTITFVPEIPDVEEGGESRTIGLQLNLVGEDILVWFSDGLGEVRANSSFGEVIVIG